MKTEKINAYGVAGGPDRIGDITLTLRVTDCDTVQSVKDLYGAAPELLTALREIVDLQGKAASGLPVSENDLRAWAVANFTARAVIAKAEGK